MGQLILLLILSYNNLSFFTDYYIEVITSAIAFYLSSCKIIVTVHASYTKAITFIGRNLATVILCICATKPTIFLCDVFNA